MKIIDFNSWTRLNTDYIKLYLAYSPRRLFYYRLVELVIYSFLNRENDYFNEND